MMGLDVSSDAFTKTMMSRMELEAAIAKLPPGEVLDLTGKSLNGLDLSGMDLRRTKLQAARLDDVNLANANLEGVVLDQAWALKSNFTGANLKNSSLFATQFGGGKLDRAPRAGVADVLRELQPRPVPRYLRVERRAGLEARHPVEAEAEEARVELARLVLVEDAQGSG